MSRESNVGLIGTLIAIGVLGYILSKIMKPVIATVTTSEGFDLSSYGGPITFPAGLDNMAHAIATAEGFYVPGSIPQQANNPGDLVMPNWSGPTLGGGISVFDSVDAGWYALKRQLYLILMGQSANYNLDMTITDMARVWTVTQQDAWALNVAGALGVSPDAMLSQVIV